MRVNTKYSMARSRYGLMSVGTGLALILVVGLVWYINNRSSSDTAIEVVLDTQDPNSLRQTLTSPPHDEQIVTAGAIPPPLPHLDFLPGSIEEECGLNGFPPHHTRGDKPPPANSPQNSKYEWLPLQIAECWWALERHIYTINPYTWGDSYRNRLFAFVVLDNPLTFERIFHDPLGDLIRVRDAMSRSECLLPAEKSNWKLNETCHAGAFLNLALINRFCFGVGIAQRERTYFWEKPTLEQDRFMWKQNLEGAWVRKKCEDLDPQLELTEEQYSDLHTLMSSVANSQNDLKTIEELLIEYGARLGDEAAGLTRPQWFPYSHLQQSYNEDGYKYGRLAKFLPHTELQDFLHKSEPSADSFWKTFINVVSITSRKWDPKDSFQIDWPELALHLCEPPDPPYVPSAGGFNLYEWKEPYPTCREIVHEIRQRGTLRPYMSKIIDNFEHAAVSLGVYD